MPSVSPVLQWATKQAPPPQDLPKVSQISQISRSVWASLDGLSRLARLDRAQK